MSIITEALKKAELEADKKRNKPILPGISLPIQNTKRNKISKNDLLKLSFLLSGILILFLTITLFKTLKRSNSVQPSVKIKNESSTNLQIKNSTDKKMVSVKKKPLLDKQITGIKPKSTKVYIKKHPKRPFASLFRTKIVLRGIMLSGDIPVAVINNQVVRENDFIEGIKILKIYDNRVLIEDKGEQVVILLKN